VSSEESRPPGRMIERVRERKEKHKQRGKVYRVFFAIGGVLVILAGLALSLPGVPGPGILLLVVGLGMLALEFDRAERLLEKILARVEHLVDGAAEAPLWQQILGGALTVLGIVAVAAAFVLWDIPIVPG
jgi:Flp pilus assembly protein TadB